jgi:hypothetical protein
MSHAACGFVRPREAASGRPGEYRPSYFGQPQGRAGPQVK